MKFFVRLNRLWWREKNGFAAWLRHRADMIAPPPMDLVPDPPQKTPPPPYETRSAPEPPSLLDNKPLVGVAEECVALFDEFDHLSGQFEPERRDLCEHVCARLYEALERSGVDVIETDGVFDRKFHQPLKRTSISDQAPPQVHVVSPGFRIDRRVLRRAQVEIDPPQG